VKYFLWVKALDCEHCGQEISLFPGNLIAQDVRHPRNVFVCQTCGELSESERRAAPGPCSHCGSDLGKGPFAKRGQIQCPHCATSNGYPRPKAGPPHHRLIALEYHCPSCRPSHPGRFFKKPDAHDLARVLEAHERWQVLDARFVPEDAIPAGDETGRLHRWGYRHYREMFNERQLIGLEASARFIHELPPGHVREALATNLSDLLRYQNLLCRYDAMALKSLDIFSVHEIGRAHV
jgi:adenine-specific DNA methylase